jgi:polyhydroxyalkanoate synthesis regulator phasin
MEKVIENLVDIVEMHSERIDIASRRVDILNDVNQMRKNTIDALIERMQKLEARVKELENGDR